MSHLATRRSASRRPGRGSARWPVPVALVALSVIPLTAGTLRLLQLAGGPQVIPADDRFAGFPAPSSSTSSAPRCTRSSASSSSCPGSAATT